MTTDRRPRRLLALACVLLLAAALAACSDDGSGGTASDDSTSDPAAVTGAEAPPDGVTQVFGAEGNDLQAYGDDGTDDFQVQQVSTNQAEDPDGGLDLNGQICFFPDDPTRFVAGEDTGQPDPPAGWGIFELEGSAVGDLSVTQLGKLTPTYQPAESDDPENYGCGFLGDGRIVTTDIGDQAAGEGNGQLIVWFPPFVDEDGDPTPGGGGASVGGIDVAHCKVDVGLATPGGIAVGEDDAVYVASARGATIGVQRYTGDWPTGPDAAGGCGRTDSTGAPLVDDGALVREQVVAEGEHDLATPNAVAIGPEGTLFVSSVVTGTVNEYEPDGTYLRTVLHPPDGEAIGPVPLSTGTPLGIAVAADGTLYLADIGIVNTPGEGLGPGEGTGSVRVVRFVDGEPQAPVTMADGLAFSDGVGIRPPG